MSYPERLEIIPFAKPPDATIRVPGSKSITNRALVLAALSGSGCTLHGALQSEDTEVMVEALRVLSFQIRADWHATQIEVFPRSVDRIIPATEASLFVGNSGTSMRFLTAMVSAGKGRYRLDGVPRMRERPIEDLLQALRQLGGRAESEKGNGCPPVIVEANGLSGGRTRVNGNISSQFLSGLLMAATRASGDVVIEVNGELVSWPYVQMTTSMMQQFGFWVDIHHGNRFHISVGQQSRADSYEIEPDASAASYFWAAAAMTAGSVQVQGLTTGSVQGDIRFTRLVYNMGCDIVRNSKSGITVQGARLRGIDADMNDISDTVMTLAAVACFADGPTTIRNVAHIRHKETDRLAALATELRRVGAEVDEFPDGLKITPRPLHGAEIETYNDHRMAMSMALIGLKVPGIVIKNPGCVAKTYPGFWDDLEKLR